MLRVVRVMALVPYKSLFQNRKKYPFCSLTFPVAPIFALQEGDVFIVQRGGGAHFRAIAKLPSSNATVFIGNFILFSRDAVKVDYISS